MNAHFADRLAALCRARGNSVCVGLDPRWQALPLDVRRRHDDGTLAAAARAFEEFCLRVLDVVAPLVPVVKPQSAFFEACGPAGLLTLQRVLDRARRHGLITLLDSKRNDIASTAKAYADAAFAGTEIDDTRHPVWNVDAVTVNPYLGADAVEPFLQSSRETGGGVFVLVRTSNRGAAELQDLECKSGLLLYQQVAKTVGAWARGNMGACGFGDVGAVVGATHPAELAEVRRLVPDVIFLIPGYGAQGAAAADCAPGFRADGLGAIVNSSRGIIACFSPEEPRWEAAVETATRATIAALRQATPMGKLK